MRKKETELLISCVCFIFLAIGAYTAWNSPATGYEASIYAATPLIFWIAVAICITTGVVIIVMRISGNGSDSVVFITIPILLIFLGFASILALFIIRGYALWTPGDPLSHLGEIQNIITNGHINIDLFYPITHIYIAQFSKICNIPISTLSKLAPFFVGLLSVPFTYCLAKVILPAKGQIILTTVVSMTFISGWFLNLTPNTLSNLMFPLVLFLMIKSLALKELRWNVLLFILIFLYPTFHPIPTIVLLLILLSMFLTNYVFNRHEIRIFPDYDSVSKFSIRNMVFLSIWFVVWLSSHSVWKYEITRIYDLIMEGAQSNLGELVTQISYASGYNYNVAEIVVKTYGGLLILAVLTLFACLILLKNRQLHRNYKYLFLFIAPLVSITFALIIFYIANLAFSPTRLLVYIAIMVTLFSGFAFYKMVEKKNILSIVLVIAIMLYLFSAGILQLYPSRYVLASNWQITKSEINGMTWYLNNKDVNYLQTSLSINVFRYADLILTFEEKSQRSDVRRYSQSLANLKLPWHFGYDEGAKLGQYYNKDLYLVINQQDRLTYTEVYPEMAAIRFLTNDFNQLERDGSVEKLYSSGGFETYYIRSLINSR